MNGCPPAPSPMDTHSWPPSSLAQSPIHGGSSFQDSLAQMTSPKGLWAGLGKARADCWASPLLSFHLTQRSLSLPLHVPSLDVTQLRQEQDYWDKATEIRKTPITTVVQLVILDMCKLFYYFIWAVDTCLSYSLFTESVSFVCFSECMTFSTHT